MTLYLLSIFFVLITVIPLIKHDGWWIRIFEFPRFQIVTLGFFIIIFGLFSAEKNIYYYLIFVAVVLSFAYQVNKVIRYTCLYPVQMVNAKYSSDYDLIKLMIANVFMDNKNYNGLVKLIHSNNPDIVLVIEVNKAWYENLNLDYPYVIAEPLDNTYGMALYSKYELKNETIEYLVEDDLPSIHTEIKLPSGKSITLHCLHPKPPAPQESTQTTERDGELLIVGKRAKNNDKPTIVAGDLNDVAWSYSTTLFQKISGLLDPRIGRGMFSTFHVKTPFLRFPLDHTFASKHFKLSRLKRLPSFDSDHFPIFIEFLLDNKISTEQKPLKLDQNEKEEADNKIEEAIR